MSTRPRRIWDFDSDYPKRKKFWRAVAWIVGLLLLGFAAYGLWCLVSH